MELATSMSPKMENTALKLLTKLHQKVIKKHGKVLTANAKQIFSKLRHSLQFNEAKAQDSLNALTPAK